MSSFKESYSEEVTGLFDNLRRGPTRLDAVAHEREGNGNIHPVGWVQNSDGSGSADSATVTIDADGITVINGAIEVRNAGATVIIDGTSNMFKIAATGTLARLGCNGTVAKCSVSTSVTIATGLTDIPAHLGFSAGPSNSAYGMPRAITSGSKPMDVVELHNLKTEVVSTNQTKVTYEIDISDVDRSGTTLTVRYYVLKEVAF